jgi:hypothetical protein
MAIVDVYLVWHEGRLMVCISVFTSAAIHDQLSKFGSGGAANKAVSCGNRRVKQSSHSKEGRVHIP